MAPIISLLHLKAFPDNRSLSRWSSCWSMMAPLMTAVRLSIHGAPISLSRANHLSRKEPWRLRKHAGNFNPRAGRYHAQIGQDDIWGTKYLHHLVNALDTNPEIAAVFAEPSYIDAKGNYRWADFFSPARLSEYTRSTLFTALLERNFLCAPGSLYRAEMFHQDFWGTSNERLQDLELWLNLILQGEFRYVQEAKMSYRIHGENLSISGTSQYQHDYEFLRMIERVCSSDQFFTFYLKLSDKEKNIFLHRLSTAFKTRSQEIPAINLLENWPFDQLKTVQKIYSLSSRKKINEKKTNKRKIFPAKN